VLKIIVNVKYNDVHKAHTGEIYVEYADHAVTYQVTTATLLWDLRSFQPKQTTETTDD